MHDLLVHRRTHGRGIPVIPLERRLGPGLADARSASSSISVVVMPGTTTCRSSARIRATSWLTRRSLSISARDRQTITSLPLHRFAAARVVDHRVQLARHALGRLRSVHHAKRRTLAVVVEHRLRRLLIHPQTLEHDVLIIVGPLHELTAALAAASLRPPGRRWSRTPNKSCGSPGAAPAPAPAPPHRRRSADPIPAAPSSHRAPAPAPPSGESRRARSLAAHRAWPGGPHDGDHHRVVDELTASPCSPLPPAPSGFRSLMASRRMSPVEIFGRPRSLRKPARLCTLACTGRSHHDDVQPHVARCYPRRPRMRVFFMKPS